MDMSRGHRQVAVISRVNQFVSSVTESITHLLCHILAALQVMVTVWKNLRLHDGHNAMLGEGMGAVEGGVE